MTDAGGVVKAVPQVNAELAGVHHRNRDGSSRSEIARRWCVPGAALVLLREPENEADPNAVSVWVETRAAFGFIRRRRQVGYLKARLAGRITPKLDAGQPVTATVKSRWLPDDGFQRVSVVLHY